MKDLVLANGLHFAVEERLEQSQRIGVAACTEHPDRLDLGVALAERQVANRLGIDRRGRGQREKRGHCCEARVRQAGDETSHRDSSPPWETCG